MSHIAPEAARGFLHGALSGEETSTEPLGWRDALELIWEVLEPEEMHNRVEFI
jgi:hypothetical protein